MSKEFENCIKNGGRVRTVVGANKDYGLEENEYVKLCFLGGKSYRGETMKKQRANEKITGIITRIEMSDTFSGKKKPVSEIEVLTEGYWEHPEYGAIELTPDDIDMFIQNFNDRTRKVDIAVDQEHNPTLGAAGWFKELKKVIEDGVTKLKAVVEWTTMGTQLVKDGIYKYFSPEFDFEYEDMETHDKYANVLLGGALTNRPYFKSLAPVQLSENIFAIVSNKFNEEGGENKMTKEEIQAKLAEDANYVLPEEASEEEVALFEEVKAELEAKPEEEEAPEAPAEEPEAEEEEAPEEESEDAEDEEEVEEEPEHVEGSETPNAKEFNDLRSKLGVLEKKLKFKEVGEKILGYSFSESNPDGRLMPKSKEVAHKLLMSLSSKQAMLFDEFVSTLPKISAMMFGEIGDSEESNSLKASEELTQKAEALAKEKGITFGEALKKVSADNKELAKRVEQGE